MIIYPKSITLQGRSAILINISSEIQKMVESFPGNYALQLSIGVIAPDDEPFESFENCPWDASEETDLLHGLVWGLLRGIIQSYGRESPIREKIKKILELIERVKMMGLLSRVDREVISGVDPDLLKLYVKTARQGNLAQIVGEVKELLELRTEELEIETALRGLKL